jgi:ADP-heptose:LPS heptosyltransferase
MGLGGALFWTALANNLKKQSPEKDIVFVYKQGLLKKLMGRNFSEYIIFENNPDISLVADEYSWFFKRRQFKLANTIVVNLSRPEYNYCQKETKERYVFKTKRHAIQILCDVHGIKGALLKPCIYLTDEEKNHARKILKSKHLQAKQFICLEPNTKTTLSLAPNKAWFRDRWCELVEKLNIYFERNNLEIKLVQIGVKTGDVLPGVVDLTGTMTFRQTAEVLSQSIFFLSYMGGLVHLAKAVDTKAVVLISAWEPKELASYPDHINLYTHIKCENCGLKGPCPINRKCMSAITVDEVFNSAKLLLNSI